MRHPNLAKKGEIFSKEFYNLLNKYKFNNLKLVNISSKQHI